MSSLPLPLENSLSETAMELDPERLKVSEKNRIDQSTELEQVTFDFNQLKKNYDSLEKKYSQNESHITEQLLIDQENNDRIESMKRRLTDYANQITNLKQDKEDELATSRELRQKIKSLIGKIDDMEHDQEAEERKRLELVRQLNKLQELNTNLQATVSELEGDLEKANSKADKSHKELLAVMEKETLSISEKDEEIEIVKKTCRGTINLLKQQLENSEQELNKMNIVKKELEQEIILIQGDLDEAEATVNELNNEIPRQQDILEQLNISLGEVSARCEALQEALVRADTKCVQLQARNEELEHEFKKEESCRKLADQDNIDLTNKINEQKSKTEGLLETLGKVEIQLEEQTGNLEALEQEKADWILEKRKMRELVTILEADNLHLEETKTTLETSESKLKARIQSILADNDESLLSIRQNNRNKIRVLENRIAELEGQLEEETTYRTETEKGIKKLERILKDMEIQAQEDTKSIERQLEQINTLTSRNKQLKTQCSEQESRVNSLQSKLRKLTAEVEESECRAATMSKMLSTPASSRANTPNLRQSRMSALVGRCTSRPDSQMSWDEYGEPRTPHAMLRISAMSRSTSRLISPEVEQIILSGRNSPVGPLATQNTSGLLRPGSGFSFSTDCNGLEEHLESNGHMTPPVIISDDRGLQESPDHEPVETYGE